MSFSPENPHGVPDAPNPQAPNPQAPHPQESPIPQPLGGPPQPHYHPQPGPPPQAASSNNALTITLIALSVIVGLLVTLGAAYALFARGNDAAGPDAAAPHPTSSDSDAAGPTAPASPGQPDPSWKSSRETTPWSDNWMRGSEIVWTLPAVSPETTFSHGINGKYLVTYTPEGSTHTVVKAYDIAGTQPREVLSQTMHKEEAEKIGFWDDMLITSTALIDLATGKELPLPWEPNTPGITTDWGVINCNSANLCALWTDPKTKVWETQLPPFQGLFSDQYANDANGGQWVMERNSEWVINMVNGDVKPITWETSLFANPPSVAIDGWIRTEPSVDKETDIVIDLHHADGTPYRSFTVDIATLSATNTLPWKKQAPSLKEYEQWFKDADMSWATSTIMAVQDAQCTAVEVAGKTITTTPGSGLVDKDPADGSCKLGGEWGKMLKTWGRSAILPLGTPPMLIDLATGQSAEHPGYNSRNQFMLVRSDLVLTPQEDGSLIARKPR